MSAASDSSPPPSRLALLLECPLYCRGSTLIHPSRKDIMMSLLHSSTTVQTLECSWQRLRLCPLKTALSQSSYLLTWLLSRSRIRMLAIGTVACPAKQSVVRYNDGNILFATHLLRKASSSMTRIDEHLEAAELLSASYSLHPS
jgi:hypothetical protein